MIEWRDIIEIIKKMFPISQTKIAELLRCNKSAITRLKKEGAQPTFTDEQMFLYIFNPANPESPASNLNKNGYYLRLLKEIIEENFKIVRESLDDCWDEQDYQTFVLRMLGRARHDKHLSPAELNTERVTNSNTAKPQSEQLHEQFLMAVRKYRIMDIINRKPAIFNLDDSADLNNFLIVIDTLLPAYNSCDTLLRTYIEGFSNSLQIQALTLEATLNNRSRFDGENAAVNMEDSDIDSVKATEIRNRLEIPEFSLELVESAKDRLHLLRAGLSEWMNFRNEMNGLFERICSWSNSTTDT